MADKIKHIIIRESSSPEEIDRAYAVMCDTTRRLINEYCSNRGISVLDLVKKAECDFPKQASDFLTKGENQITGVDLECLLSHTELTRQFAEGVPVIISPEAEPVKCISARGAPKAIEEYVQQVFPKIVWFYLQATERYK